ncbi:MAG: UDP-N-acetylglucosamine 2-epimerase (non-hydrolyzing) [Pirellulales bacterium]|nr:UDP-N-acetylglucosamine 2-epimerase (non-hydrolyzing) [Pirellulales bacterium]
MATLRFACIVGARPNFMKMAPLLRALDAYANVETVLVHTGQHYDKNLSDIFFEQLEMRRPDVTLEVGSGSHAVQTARVIERFETVLVEAAEQGKPFDRLIVVGDVNSTMATTLAAAKLHVPVAHVEAGLRSFDRTMPEEINRIVTDAIADLLLVSEPNGMENLLHEGHSEDHVRLVGNVMIDTLKFMLPKAQQCDTPAHLGVSPGKYGVVTLHRPANVDTAETLGPMLDVLIDVSERLPVVFPIHPRTVERIKRYGMADKLAAAKGIIQTEPLGYLEFLALTSQAKVIVTDSGGLQEESTVLGIPCLTARPNTERPITVTQGTSTLVGNDAGKLRSLLGEVLDGTYRQGTCPELWDGHAAERIARILVEES